MRDEVTDFLYKYIMNNNPSINEEDIDYYNAVTNNELLIKYKNGSKVIYDTLNNTSHYVRYSDEEYSNDDVRDQLKRRLQYLMNIRWVTQDELAKRIGTSQQMISRYLTGRSIPSAITLKRIALALGCSVDDFYYNN